jgi:hypothetical protein
MGAWRNAPLSIEPAANLHQAWLQSLFECEDCGCKLVIVYPQGKDPLAMKPQCRWCGAQKFFDHDGIDRDWRTIN